MVGGWCRRPDVGLMNMWLSFLLLRCLRKITTLPMRECCFMVLLQSDVFCIIYNYSSFLSFPIFISPLSSSHPLPLPSLPPTLSLSPPFLPPSPLPSSRPLPSLPHQNKGSPFLHHIIMNGFDERHAYIGGMFGAGTSLLSTAACALYLHVTLLY